MLKSLRQWLLLSLGICFGIVGQAKIVVAVDAGHGGSDPGTIGKVSGLKEKDVVLAIASHLKAHLDADPNFKAVMIRNSDIFIGVVERSNVARRNKADYLISIHADSFHIPERKGFSVRVLNNARVNQDLDKWIDDKDKQSELLGGVGDALSNTKDSYLEKAMIDMQFSSAQRGGHALGKEVIKQMSKIHTPINNAPIPQDLGVLSAPDIPSILVEAGFLTNAEDEKRLSTDRYRRQVANAIYQGLVSYTKKHHHSSAKTVKTSYKEVKTAKAPVKNEGDKTSAKANIVKSNEKATSAQNSKEKSKNTANTNVSYHIVEQDQTLYSIARLYKTTPEKLSELNNIKNNKIVVGQKLKLK